MRMDFAGIRRLKGSCPIGGEHVERVKIATAGYAVERYRCPEHGTTTYAHGVPPPPRAEMVRWPAQAAPLLTLGR